MNVLVDTSVWSLALRRKRPPDHPHVAELAELIKEGRATIIGAIRQEVLSGIRSRTDFDRLRGHLRAFPDLPVSTEDHERAAELLNACRARGIQGSNADVLLCAVAERYGMELLTTDEDFRRFAHVVPLVLRQPREIRG